MRSFVIIYGTSKHRVNARASVRAGACRHPLVLAVPRIDVPAGVRDVGREVEHEGDDQADHDKLDTLVSVGASVSRHHGADVHRHEEPPNFGAPEGQIERLRCDEIARQLEDRSMGG